MSFDATVYRILIASPGDVGEERNVIPEIINEWNAVSAVTSKKVLMPIKWETHSSPLLGDRPQGVINNQVVKDCDLLVGLFWTRIGTHTGVAVSGTAEEIEQFVASGKPVMLYFSQTPVDPDKIEIEQFSTLRNFKEKMRLKGLTESYSGIHDFRHKFSRQLGININNLFESDLKDIAAKGKPTAKKKVELVDPVSLPSITEEEAKHYLIKAQQTTANGDGRADLASFAGYLRTYTPIDYKKAGFSKLKQYLESTGLFEFESITPTHVLVKLTPKALQTI
ncbi:MAG TPA: OST-HTH/LOTUS domain-containing protein [Geobacteraceae bacterium]